MLGIMSSSSVLTELPCLGSVLEFLPLVEMTRCSGMSKAWNLASFDSPLLYLDTVGISVSLDRLVQIVKDHRRTLVSLRVSFPRAKDLDRFACELMSIMQDMPCLKQIALFSAYPDGSVRMNLHALSEIDRFSFSWNCDPKLESLVLGVDDLGSHPGVRDLLLKSAKTLSSLAFLKGCETLFRTDSELTEFVSNTLSLDTLKCLHLGFCDSSIDMDPVIAAILSRASSLEYIQWSGSGASIDMMKSLMGCRKMHCAFEGVGFLSMLLGL